MSNKVAARVRDTTEIDPRVARSTRALGHALIALIRERELDEITVQQILDRAGVGRATFYAHFRNKEDVLQSTYDRLFAMLEPLAARRSASGPRLFPVAEFLEHVGHEGALVHALRRDGRLEEVWALFTSYVARIIERRLDAWAVIPDTLPPRLLARMLAGALMESLRWWQEHPTAATPAAMDAAFHELARGLLRRPALAPL